MAEMYTGLGTGAVFEGTGLTDNVNARPVTRRRSPYRLSVLVVGLSVAALLSGCATEPTKVASRTKSKSKEYFSEIEYGVKASPRVVAAALHLPGMKAVRMPRGGGRDQVGKPYKVRGKWYYPKEETGYDRKGMASWYGDAFHGRLTANGEVYDMNHLSAAHPTMPLPSYARVTNLKNGSSVIVRVNDRGPYAHGRVIDLSKRAAYLLDYASSGTAKVRVEYVGRAPVDGADDNYLMASFQSGDGGVAPADAMQPNVMVAMAGPTPAMPGAAQQIIFEGERPVMAASMSIDAGQDPFAMMVHQVLIPDIGPIVPDKPAFDPLSGMPMASAQSSGAAANWVSAYADERINVAYGAASPFSALKLNEEQIKASWKRQNPSSSESIDEYVLLGSFSKTMAAELSAKLDGAGRLIAEEDGNQVTIRLESDGRAPLDALLQLSWNAGAQDAFVVRD